MSDQNSIFRKVSLDRLSSPEQLDKTITVISPIGWAAVAALAFFILAAVVWGCFGIISNKVNGSGVLMDREGIVKITSQSGGRITDIGMRAGDHVEKDQVIAVVEQEDLARQIEQMKDNISALRALDTNTLVLDVDFLNGEIYSEFVQLAGQIRSSRAQLEAQRAEAEKSEKQQTQQINELKKQEAAVLKQLGEELAKAKVKLEEEAILFGSGAISKNEYDLYAEAVSKLEEKIRTGNDAQLESIRMQLISLDPAYSKQIWGAYNQVSDQVASLKEQFSKQQQVILHDYSKRLQEMEEQYSEKSVIAANASGVISALKIQQGDFVQPGEALGNIVRDDPRMGVGEKAAVILYVPLDKGKLVDVGMDVKVSPTTVNREEHGYIIGRVVSVSASSVTQDHMMSTLQNMQLVLALSMDNAVLEVEVELESDGGTESGYHWSTPKGAPFAIRSGTVCGGEIIVSNQRPIQKVVPFFKRLFQ